MVSPGRNERENPVSIFNMEPSHMFALTKISTNNNSSENNHIIELYINNEYKGLYRLDAIKMSKGGRGNE
jgi:hypothetical protein